MSKGKPAAGRSFASPHQAGLLRHGEGHEVPIHITSVTSVTGKGEGILRADLSSVPVPAKRYPADTCYVVHTNEIIFLLFAQLVIGAPDKLRNLLVVKMTPSSVKRYLDMTNDIKGPSIEDIAKKMEIEGAKLSAFPGEPAETVAFNANLGLTGVSGHEGCIDFYHSSPFAIGAAIKNQKLALDPVVRVDISTRLLVGLLTELQSLIGSMDDHNWEITGVL